MAQTISSPLIGKVVTPGDVVLQLPEEGDVRIGVGLRIQEETLVSQRAGVLKQTKAGRLWVEGRQKRYIPAEGDMVVGIIRDRLGEVRRESWSLDVNGPFPAQLPMLAFEGVTRRNRPNLKTGDVVYARVVTANKDMDPELSCVDAIGRAVGFGPLQGGLVFGVNSAYARALASKPRPPVLVALEAAEVAFEMAVGANGRVWVKAEAPAGAVVVSQAIIRAEAAASEQQVEQIVRELRAAVEL